MKKWKSSYTALSLTEKGMILMSILLLLLILTRFDYISHQAKKGFGFFSPAQDTVQTPQP